MSEERDNTRMGCFAIIVSVLLGFAIGAVWFRADKPKPEMPGNVISVSPAPTKGAIDLGVNPSAVEPMELFTRYLCEHLRNRSEWEIEPGGSYVVIAHQASGLRIFTVHSHFDFIFFNASIVKLNADQIRRIESAFPPLPAETQPEDLSKATPDEIRRIFEGK